MVRYIANPFIGHESEHAVDDAWLRSSINKLAKDVASAQLDDEVNDDGKSCPSSGYRWELRFSTYEIPLPDCLKTSITQVSSEKTLTPLYSSEHSGGWDCYCKFYHILPSSHNSCLAPICSDLHRVHHITEIQIVSKTLPWCSNEESSIWCSTKKVVIHLVNNSTTSFRLV